MTALPAGVSEVDELDEAMFPVMTVNVSAERNTKGWNVSATVVNALSVQMALDTLKEATDGLQAQYRSAA